MLAQPQEWAPKHQAHHHHSPRCWPSPRSGLLSIRLTTTIPHGAGEWAPEHQAHHHHSPWCWPSPKSGLLSIRLTSTIPHGAGEWAPKHQAHLHHSPRCWPSPKSGLLSIRLTTTIPHGAGPAPRAREQVCTSHPISPSRSINPAQGNPAPQRAGKQVFSVHRPSGPCLQLGLPIS